jgi:hypothetical protein
MRWTLACLPALAWVLACPACPALAQGQGVLAPGLTPAGREWRAVGRLEVAGESFCTVTLIGPEQALTAAHCVIDARTGRVHPPEALVLHLGYAHGRAEVTRGVRTISLAQPPEAPRDRETTLARVARDVALLALDRPVRQSGLDPIAVAAPGAQVPARLTVVSYARGREQLAALQDDCRHVSTRSDGALVLDCAVDHGASGAPVMDHSGGRPRIVAVISARARIAQDGAPEADVALAAPIHAPRAAPAMVPAPGAARVVPPVAQGNPAGGEVRIRRAGQAQAPQAQGPRRLRPPPAPEAVIR